MSDNRRAEHCGLLLFRTVVVLAAVVLGMEGFMKDARAGNPLKNPPFSLDGLVLLEGAEDLLESAEEANGVVASPAGRWLELEQEAAFGRLITRRVKGRFPFNESIPSWNGRCPDGTGFRIYLRVGKGAEWTPWVEMGMWGDLPSREEKKLTSFEDGWVDVDILFSARPTDEFQFRLDLHRSESAAGCPGIRLLAMSYSNTAQDKELWEHHSLGEQTKHSPCGTEIRLEIPYRSQHWETTENRGSICSPTSVSMALEAYGILMKTADVAALALDPDHGIYGNWSRNIQVGAHHGLRGYLDRFRDWGKVRRELEKGHILSASIRFNRDQLARPPYPVSGGHLLIVRGLTENGDVITNDPALGKDNRGDGFVWKAEDFEKAWFDHGGVAYVFTGPFDE